MVNEGVEEEIAFLFPRLEASAKRKRKPSASAGNSTGTQISLRGREA
jgi:hypothetical protein